MTPSVFYEYIKSLPSFIKDSHDHQATMTIEDKDNCGNFSKTKLKY